jgi:hypothetical protein
MGGIFSTTIGRFLNAEAPVPNPVPPPPVPSPPPIPHLSPDEATNLAARVRRAISDRETLRAILATLPNVNPDDECFSQFYE